MRSEQVIARAGQLRHDAAALREEAARLRGQARTARQRYPWLRLLRVARGSSDDPIETRERRCPHCSTEAVTPLGKVLAVGGIIKVAHRCEDCRREFMFIRKPSV